MKSMNKKADNHSKSELSKNISDVKLLDLFDLKEIQRLQDEFSDATGIASIITLPDGTPITAPSNFCRLCNEIIRKTKKGRNNCYHSDAEIGREHPEGPIIQPCMSGGLWDAGTAITVGGTHIANWLIGQVRDNTQTEEGMREYARQIGADEDKVVEAFYEVPSMSHEQFTNVAKVLFTLANQLSQTAYQNLKQLEIIAEKEKIELALKAEMNFTESALDAQLDTFFVFDSERGKAIRWNKAFRDISGYTDEEIANLPVPASYYSDEGLAKATRFFQSIYQEGSGTIELDLICKDGHLVPTEYLVSLIKDDSGNPKYFISIGRDISERKKVERKLKESEQKFRSLYDNINVALALHEMIYDENGTPVDFIFLDCNLAYEEMTLLKKKNIIGKRAADVIPNLEKKWIDTYGKVARTGQSITIVDHSEYLDKHWEVKAYSPKKDQFAVALSDITKRIKIENALKESEAKFRSIVESSPMGMHLYHLNENNRLIFSGYNQKTDQMLSIDHNQLLGKTVIEAFPLLAETEIPEKYFNAAKYGESWSTEQINYHDDNITGAFEVHAFQTEPNKMAVMFLDIRDRKKAEELLLESEEKFRTITEQMTDMVFLTDEKGIINYVSPVSKLIFGYDPDEMHDHLFMDFLDKADISKAVAAFQIAIQNNENTRNLELRMKRKDGTIFTGELNGTFYKSNIIVGTIGIIRDITDRKQAEERLKILFESAPDAYYLNDMRGKFIDGNEAAVKLIGYSKEEIIGNNFFDLNILDKNQIKKAASILAKNVLGKATGPDEIVLRNKKGQHIYVDVVTHPVRIQNELLVLGIARDISERKKMENERESLISDLETKNAEMERFIYTISHDLKSPMITIQGFIGLIKRELKSSISDDLSAHFTKISDATRQMEHLLKDLLELSRIGRVVNPTSTISMTVVVIDAYKLLEGVINKHCVNIEIQSEMPVVTIDRTRIQEVWTNLIENAIKYRSPKRKCKIIIGSKTLNTKTVFFIKDNSLGIMPDYHDKVFGLFDQLDPNIEGTGVGLALVKRIIEFHGGKIWVESKGINKGSTFCFTLS